MNKIFPRDADLPHLDVVANFRDHYFIDGRLDGTLTIASKIRDLFYSIFGGADEVYRIEDEPVVVVKCFNGRTFVVTVTEVPK